jgi:hypothetical protein
VREKKAAAQGPWTDRGGFQVWELDGGSEGCNRIAHKGWKV